MGFLIGDRRLSRARTSLWRRYEHSGAGSSLGEPVQQQVNIDQAAVRVPCGEGRVHPS